LTAADELDELEATDRISGTDRWQRAEAACELAHRRLRAVTDAIPYEAPTAFFDLLALAEVAHYWTDLFANVNSDNGEEHSTARLAFAVLRYAERLGELAPPAPTCTFDASDESFGRQVAPWLRAAAGFLAADGKGCGKALRGMVPDFPAGNPILADKALAGWHETAVALRGYAMACEAASCRLRRCIAEHGGLDGWDTHPADQAAPLDRWGRQ
jgi:hypothetical protein